MRRLITEGKLPKSIKGELPMVPDTLIHGERYTKPQAANKALNKPEALVLTEDLQKELPRL
jgi:hypothetical protein